MTNRTRNAGSETIQAHSNLIPTSSEQWFKSLFTHTASAIVRVGVGWNVIECNKAFPALTGRSVKEIRRSGLGILFGKGSWDAMKACFASPDADEGSVYETSIVHADGREIAVMVGVTPATIDGVLAGHFVILRKMIAQNQALDALHDTLKQLRDARDTLELQVKARTQELKDVNLILKRQIVERERAEETVRWQANHDSLTGLPNRLMFRQRLDAAIQSAGTSGERVAVLFVDLDRFKNVNDTLGHAVGDELLKQVSFRFQTCLTSDTMLCRMGGDEFTVVVPGMSESSQANSTALRLLATLDRPFVISGSELYICGSIGVSVFPDNGQDCQTLLQYADIAMYKVKGAGGGAVKQYSDVPDSRIGDRVALETSLRRGLDRSEMVLHYQPQVSLETGEIVGVEALVRWIHPELGLLLPRKFIPIAEETGLILRLGEWVMQEACRQAREWEVRGHPMRVAVNVFARQFEQPGLVDQVSHLIRMTGLNPDLLDLELTESALVRNCESVRETLNSLRSIGVRSSLDDFGTGYSSLSYLRRLPINTLKIDQSFVSELVERVGPGNGEQLNTPDGCTAAKIIRAVIEVAHALGLMTVAEGVETEHQRDTLFALGCDLMQGFLFSKALPVAELESLLEIQPTMKSRAA